MSNKYTPEGLPVLTKDTLKMHFTEEKKLDRESEDSLLKVLERRAEIFEENPVLEEALDRFCREYNFEGMDELCVQAAGVFVYQLMKRQADVNRLEE